MTGLAPIALHTGRVLLAALFILAGVNKLLNYAPTAVQMADAGLPFVGALLPLTITVELVGGLLVALGWRGAVPAAMMLIAYTAAVNLVFHPFWQFDGARALTELSLFFKNLSISGGLLYVAGVTARDRVSREPPKASHPQN